MLDNFQQICIPQDKEIIEQFINGNIGQFIDQNGTLNIPCGVKVIEQQIQDYKYKSNISEVIIPDSVVYIVQYAFFDCTGIINVTMKDTIIEIGQYAFYNCQLLENIILSKQLKFIGDYVFQGCYQLKSIVIPSSVTYLGQEAFENCINLQNIVLSNNIQRIYSYTFYNCKQLQQIVIPSSIKQIDEYAFGQCISIKTLVIPKSLINIYNTSFSNCQKLSCIVVLNENAEIGNAFNQYTQNTSFKNSSGYCLDDNYNYCDDETYKYIYNLNTPDICIREEYVYLYYINEQQQRISVQTCPDQYSFIDIDAEPYQCIDECLNNIYGIYCSQYEKEQQLNKIFTYQNLDYFIANGTLTVPEGIQVISYDIQLYQLFKSIINVTSPSTLIGIGERVFQYSSIQQINFPTNLQIIGQKSFQESSLEVIQSNYTKIKNIYNYTFSSSKIVNIQGFQNVEKIYNYAFFTGEIQYIDTTDKLVYIGEYAFGYCTKFKQMINISGIKNIDQYAFIQCVRLTSVVFPTTLAYIGSQAFGSCSRLKCIVIQNPQCDINPSSFQNTLFQDTYINYIGSDLTCPSYIFDNCDMQSYIYRINVNGVEYCTNKDNTNYFYQDTDGNKYRVEDCEEIDYQYQSQSDPIECLQQCNGSYAFPIDNENICDSTCNYYQFNETSNQCVTDCTNVGEEYIYIQYDNEERDRYQCVTGCQYYQYTNGSFTVCTQNMSCDGIFINGMNLKYLQGNVCQEGCTEDYAYPSTGRICSNTCNYYQLNESAKQCVQNDCSSADYDFVYNRSGRYECISECNTNKYVNEDQYTVCTLTDNCDGVTVNNVPYEYIEEKVCVQQCSGDYAEPESEDNKICDQSCKYYQQGEYKHCMSQCSGTYNYTVDLPDTQRDYCVSDCSTNNDGYTLTQGSQCVTECSENMVQNENQCLSNCPENQYVQNGQCQAECNDSYAYPEDDSMICDNTCQYHIEQNGSLQCDSICDGEYSYQYYITSDQRHICVNNCSEVSEDYAQNNICVSSCTEQYAHPMNSGYICSNSCAFRVDIDNNSKYCVSDNNICPDNMYLVQQHENRDECINETEYYVKLDNGTKQSLDSCNGQYQYIVKDDQNPKQCTDDCNKISGYQYVQVTECVEQCYGEYAQPEQGYICDNKCQYHIDNGYKYCDSVCNDTHPYYVNLDRDQCVVNCSEILSLNYSQGYMCVNQCMEDYAYPQSGNICDNTCMYQIIDNSKYCTQYCTEQNQEYVINSTIRKYCAENCEGQNQYNISFTNDYGVKFCVDQCPNNYIEQNNICVYQSGQLQCQEQQYIQDNQCVDNCAGQYANPLSGKQCDISCIYYNNEQNIKQCVKQCQQPYQYQVQESRQYCIDNCNNTINYKYQQENNCVSICTDEYAYPEVDNICNNTCQYYQFNMLKYCMSQCRQPYQYTVNTNSRNYCVYNCSNEQIYKLTQNQQCVEQCYEEYIQQEDQCLIIDNDNQDDNNQTSLILGTTIPAIIIVIVVVAIITTYICKRQRKIKNKDIVNIIIKNNDNKNDNKNNDNGNNKPKKVVKVVKKVKKEQKMNEQQALSEIQQSSNLKPINITVNNENNSKYVNNQLLSSTQEKQEIRQKQIKI